MNWSLLASSYGAVFGNVQSFIKIKENIVYGNILRISINIQFTAHRTGESIQFTINFSDKRIPVTLNDFFQFLIWDCFWQSFIFEHRNGFSQHVIV